MNENEKLDPVNDRWLHILCLVLFAALIIVLVPILYLSFFAHTALDDFSFGWRNAIALREGRSLLISAISTAKQYYMGWQGTFSAVALMSLVPSLFGERFYFLTTFILAFMLCFSTCKLSRTLAVRLLSLPKRAAWVFSLTLLILSFCFLPSPSQGLYWWNGAVYYTFFYSLMLLLIDQLLLVYIAEKSSAVTGHFILGAFLSVAVSGGNYVSALLSIELIVFWVILIAVRKRKRLILALIILLLFAAGFIFSFSAPGNAVRQANETGGLNPIKAVIQSIIQSFKDFALFFDPTVYICLIISILIFRRLIPRTDFKFRYPVLVQLLCFLLYASQHVPHFYAVGTSGPERMQNIFFYSHLWFLFFSALYWTGFISKRINFSVPINWKKAITLVLAVILVGTAAIQCFRIKPLPAKIVQAVRDSSIETYDTDMDARVVLFEDESVRSVYLTPLRSKPKLLFIWDCDPDPENWANVAIRYYYGKDLVAQAQEG